MLAGPSRVAAFVLPRTDRLVAGRVVYLKDRLRPAAAHLGSAALTPLPTIAADENVQVSILVTPVLPPVLLHERALELARLIGHEQHHQMLKPYECAGVLDDVNVLGAP